VHRHRQESASRSIVANPRARTPTPSCGAPRPRLQRPRLSGPRATRFAPSAWPTAPPLSDRAICSWRGPSPHKPIARGGIERFEGRALAMKTQRAANKPSFECSRDLLVGAPRPDQEIPVGGCPLPPAPQRDLGVDQASKICGQQAELPAADGVRWRARPTWIDRGRSAIRAVRPGYASPSFWARTGGPTGHGPSPWSPSRAVLTDRRPKPDATAHGHRKRFAEIRLCGARHRAPAVGRTLLLQPPPRAAIGRRERALSSALMPGCPAGGRRSQTSTHPTLLRSQPNTRGSRRPHTGMLRIVGVEPWVRYRRTSSNGGELAPVSSTDSRARRGRR
jgi:hypothetical protein